MSFLAPLFLVGALAVGLPVLFHLIRRTTRVRERFSSLMFLLPSPPRLTRRSRLEHILLLVMRCAVICVLAAGFARPVLRRFQPPAQSAAARRLLILIDTSASMRRADLWADACARAQTVLRQAGVADQVAIFTFDRQLKPVLSFDEWNTTAPADRTTAAAAKLARIAPGWSNTHLGSALTHAAEILADTSGNAFNGARQLVLISDLQQGSHLEPLQGYEWPRGIQVQLETVRAKLSGNATLQVLAEPDDGSVKQAVGIRVRVTNNPDSRHEQFQVGWSAPDSAAFTGSPLTIYVPPGQSRVAMIPLSGPSSDRIRLTGDDDDFDNNVFVVPPETVHLNVLYIGVDKGNPRQPFYFLQRAFQETRHRAVAVDQHSPDIPLSPDTVSNAALVVIADSIPEATTSVIRDQVVGGKAALFLLGNADQAQSLRHLLRIESLSAEEIRPPSYALLGQLDFQHPILASFADPRFSDFTKIHFWKYRKIDPATVPGARVLAAFDSGDPALLEVPLGAGRLFVLTSGWQPDDSQLALSTKFVPLLYSILDQSGASAPMPPQFFVGDSIPVRTAGALQPSALRVTGPDGSNFSVEPTQTNFFDTFVPGVYTLESQPRKRFAVNLDPTESLTMPVSVDDLERLGVPITRAAIPIDVAAARQARLANAELEARQKLWRWLLVVALAIAFAETWLAGKGARTPSPAISSTGRA